MPPSHLTLTAALLAGGIAAACSGRSSPAGADAQEDGRADAAPTADGPVGAPERVLGGVQVRDRGAVPVWVWDFTDAPMPGRVFGVVGEGTWEPTIVAGDCMYLTALEPGFCDPACGSESYCDANGECQPWPAAIDAGEMLLEGLAQDVTLTPSDNGYYGIPDGLPEVMFTGGETATVTAEGNQLPAFTLSTVTPDPLAADPDCDMELVSGEDLTITWTPSGVGRVRWEMITMMHAGNGPMVLCETGDTGSLVVSGDIIAQYLADRTQWPTYQLSRYTRDFADVGDGNQVALETLSTRHCFGTP